MCPFIALLASWKQGLDCGAGNPYGHVLDLQWTNRCSHQTLLSGPAIVMRTQFVRENCFPRILWEYMVEAGWSTTEGTNLCDKQNHLKPFPGDQNASFAWDLLLIPPPCSKPQRICLPADFNSLSFLPNLDKSSSLL